MSPLLGHTNPPGRTAVYRLFDASGTLLYIGSSNNPRVRCYEHASTKRWWPEVASRTEAWFETRVEALAEEKRAIGVEQPQYNVGHTPPHRKISAFKDALTPAEAAFWATTKPKEPQNLGRKPWHMVGAVAPRNFAVKPKATADAPEGGS